MQKFQANKYGWSHVELSINGSPRRILKAIRRLHRQSEDFTANQKSSPPFRNLHRQSETSTQLDSTTEFRNSLPSPDIEKRPTLNIESVEHSQKLSEIKKNYKKKVDSNDETSKNLYIDTVLFSKFFSGHSNIFEWKSSSKTLTKVVEIHNGKRFVRMECVTECNSDNIPQMYFSKAYMNDVDLEYSKKKSISEYDYRIAARNPCSNFVHEDKFHFVEKGLVLPDSIKSYCVSNCENNLTNNQLTSQTKNALFQMFNLNTKVTPNEMYQTCLELKNKPISYIWESTSQQFKHDTEFVFDVEHSSTSETVTDEKLQISDKSDIKECRGANFKHKILQTEVYEPLQGVRETTVSLSNEIRNRKKILDSLEKNTDLFIKELFDDDADDTDCLSMAEPLELNFNHKHLLNSNVNNSSENEEFIYLHGSQGIPYPELETNKPISCIWEGTPGEYEYDTEFVFDMEDISTSDIVTDEKVQIFDNNSSFSKDGLISFDNPQGIQYPELKTNKLAKSLGSQSSTFIEEKSYESLKYLGTIDKSYNDIYTALFDNEKENVHDKIRLMTTPEQSGYVDFNFKSSKFQNDYEENKELLMLPSESTLLLLDNLLFHLQDAYQIIEKEVHSWLLNSGTYQSDSEIQNFKNETSCESVRALTDKNCCFTNSNYLQGRNRDATVRKCDEGGGSSSVQFSNSYANNSFKKNEMISLDRSLDIQYSVKEMNKLSKCLRNQKSAFTKGKSLNTIDASNEEYYISLLDNLKNTFDDKTSLVSSTKQSDSFDFHYNVSKYQNESEDNKNLLILPYESEFLLLDNILFRLQNTYQNVEKEVQSWLLNNRIVHVDSKIQESICKSVTELADENSCFTNGNCLMRFEGKNGDTNVRKCDEWRWSCLNSDVLSLQEGNEPESDLDDSESSLEGSFKQLRTDSRASTVSSGGDSNDFDDIPRFSLPFRKSNEQKFHTTRTELCDEVSRKEWSWRNTETEISWKWSRKRTSFRSEEHGAFGISKNVLPDGLGIPEDLLRDFNVMTLQSENSTDV